MAAAASPSSAATASLAFAAQMLVVFAGNSRIFGLLKPGSGWYTNVEMAERYSSLVTPARFAFAIWGIIYTWEMAAMAYLWLTAEAPHGWSIKLWCAANIAQALWAPLFALERLGLSAIALSCIAISLILLGSSLRGATGFDYWLLAAPVWLHAGWTSAASIVNLNLVLAAHGTSAAAQLAAAFASSFAAFYIGLAVVASGHVAAWPFASALLWALYAIRSELLNPDLIKGSAAYAAIGETGRAALQMGVAGSAAVLAAGALGLSVVCASWPEAVGVCV